VRASEFIQENTTGQWDLLVSSHDKTHWGDELINLVHSAYKNADLGSFVNSLNDVQRSDWLVLDWDQDNRKDCAIFYRQNRPNETWSGNKIQGIGHDRRPESKKYTLDRVKSLLAKGGWWVESAGSLANSLGNLGLAPVTDEATLQALFPNTDLRMLDRNGKYERRLPEGSVIQEIVYGKPNVKRAR